MKKRRAEEAFDILVVQNESPTGLVLRLVMILVATAKEVIVARIMDG